MGSVLLIAALLIEAAFATYCIITKSNQQKTRSFIQIGAFAVFGILALTSVIQWGFRWYGLAALLFICMVLGTWTLIRKKEEKTAFSTGRILFKALVMLPIFVIALLPALIFPQYILPRMTGTHKVATVNYTYTDKSRIETFTNTGENRKVNVEFWYPKDATGKFPLVVFSPGSFGIKGSNTSTFKELASNGYVVCSIDHPYHSLYTIDDDGRLTRVDSTFIQELIDANSGKYDEVTVFKIEQKWMNLRTTDINFVLNTVLVQAKDISSDAVYQLIDSQKIGLIGHSLGGAASAQVARERHDISAVVNLDADLLGEYLDYTNGKYVLNDRVYPVPILTIFADDMVRLMDAVKDPNEVIAVKHVTATAPKAFEIHFTGTDHMSLTDLPLVSPFLVSMINTSIPKGGGQEIDAFSTIEKMNSNVLAFFDDFLKDKGTFTSKGIE
jgi:dienelactone hydrolase